MRGAQNWQRVFAARAARRVHGWDHQKCMTVSGICQLERSNDLASLNTRPSSAGSRDYGMRLKILLETTTDR
jgi:hypothetical protein